MDVVVFAVGFVVSRQTVYEILAEIVSAIAWVVVVDSNIAQQKAE